MRRTITAAILLATLAGSAAMAGSPPHWTNDQGRDQQRDSRDRGQNRRDDDRGNRQYTRDPRSDSRNNDWHHGKRAWRDDRRDFVHERFRGGRYYAPRGYYEHRWHRGDRLPHTYYSRPYIVNGYRGYHLYDPPRGCHWVRVRNDVLLTAIATGVVLDAVYDLYY
jgi:Ni/Co efflux regulator RcnB